MVEAIKRYLYVYYPFEFTMEEVVFSQIDRKRISKGKSFLRNIGIFILQPIITSPLEAYIYCRKTNTGTNRNSLKSGLFVWHRIEGGL